MLVKDRMSTPPLTIRTNADYKMALKLMQEHGLHHVPVLDSAGALAGILAERDLLIAAMRYLQSAVEVNDIMHRDVVTVTPDTPITRAAGLMLSHKIGGLPVMGADRRVVGMITESDIFKAFVEMLPEEKVINARFHMRTVKRVSPRVAGVAKSRRFRRVRQPA